MLQTHPHYHGFTDYGDAENYRAELTRLRAELMKMRTDTSSSGL
jgi:hypothetical protein